MIIFNCVKGTRVTRLMDICDVSLFSHTVYVCPYYCTSSSTVQVVFSDYNFCERTEHEKIANGVWVAQSEHAGILRGLNSRNITTVWIRPSKHGNH